MCDLITAYLEKSNEQWDSINIICKGECDKQRSCVTFMGETITTSPLIEEYDKNREKIISVLGTIQNYTDSVYIYTDLKMFSATLKKICIDAFYTAIQKDIFISTVANKNMYVDWSVYQGFMKEIDANVVHIFHAKQQLFEKIPVF